MLAFFCNHIFLSKRGSFDINFFVQSRFYTLRQPHVIQILSDKIPIITKLDCIYPNALLYFIHGHPAAPSGHDGKVYPTGCCTAA